MANKVWLVVAFTVVAKMKSWHEDEWSRAGICFSVRFVRYAGDGGDDVPEDRRNTAGCIWARVRARHHKAVEWQLCFG